MSVMDIMADIQVVINDITDFKSGHGEFAPRVLILLALLHFYIFISVDHNLSSVRFDHLYPHRKTVFAV